jgi:hypothetical protein
VVGTISASRGGAGLFERLFGEGFALMWERRATYALFALACAVAGATSLGRSSLLETFQSGNPAAVLRATPINVILLAALLAIFFVLPSALRRIQPSFRMNVWRAVVTLAVLLCLAVATDLGYAAAVIPGIVLGVLLSQALIAALLGSGERGSPREFVALIGHALKNSLRLTKEHFVTTLGICALSLLILGIPFTFGLIGMLVLDALEPRTLVLTAPALFLTFVYCECVRYVLIVRWYGRLNGISQNAPKAA